MGSAYPSHRSDASSTSLIRVALPMLLLSSSFCCSSFLGSRLPSKNSIAALAAKQRRNWLGRGFGRRLAVQQQQRRPQQEGSSRGAPGVVTVVVREPSEAYAGPVPESGRVEGLVGAIDIEPYGIILEVGDSAVVPGEKGVFIRLREPEWIAVLPSATVLCSYNSGVGGSGGSMTATLPPSSDATADRAVSFDLSLRTSTDGGEEEEGDLDPTVLYDGLICRLVDLLAREDSPPSSSSSSSDRGYFHGLSALAGLTPADGGGEGGGGGGKESSQARHVLQAHPAANAVRVAGHDVAWSENEKGEGRPRVVTINISRTEALFFVPAVAGAHSPDLGEGQEEVTLLTAGQFLNDLAVDFIDGNVFCAPSRPDYNAASAERNIAVLHWRLELAEGQRSLRPTGPVMVLEHTVKFTNAEPMEIGCKYGHGFWEAWAEQRALERRDTGGIETAS